MTDRNFRHFGPFFAFQPLDNLENQNSNIEKKTPGDIILHVCTITDNHIMYDSWDMECHRYSFLSFWTNFCPFTTPPPYGPGKSKFGSSDMESNRQNILSFRTIFCPFTPLTTPKIKILKKWKNFLEISFYTGVT